jgi:stage II sporulation protein D
MKAVLREAGLPLQGQEVGAVKVVSRDESGRVLQLQVNGTRISGTRFWLCAGRALGRRRICSTLFRVRKQGSSYIFEGRGYGHGAGLCQWGAKALAESGMTWPQILKRYYPALQLSSTPPKLDYVQPGYYH